MTDPQGGSPAEAAGSTGPKAAAPPSPVRPPLPNDPEALQQAVQERQRRLAATMDELVQRVRPAEVARRSAASARARAHDAVVAEDGTLRAERLLAVAVAALGLVGAVWWRRRRA